MEHSLAVGELFELKGRESSLEGRRGLEKMIVVVDLEKVGILSGELSNQRGL